MMDTKELDKLQVIGSCAYEAIADMVAACDVDYDRLSDLAGCDELDALEQEELDDLIGAANGCESFDEAEQMIYEDPLSLRLGGWWSCGAEPQAERFEILLGTGGPATRIIGELGMHGEPVSAELQAQGWFTPWETYRDADEDVLLSYCQRFLFT